MRKGIVLILLSIVLVLIISPTTTNALSCVEMPTGEKGYEEYDGIIVGHVEDVVRKDDNNIIKLKVIKSYKKIDVEQISVKENMTWGSLSGPSEIGEEYLFYLRESNSGWENPLCSPTMKVANATEELVFLQDKEVTIQKMVTPLSPDHNDRTEWVIVVGVAVVVVFVIWRLRSAIK